MIFYCKNYALLLILIFKQNKIRIIFVDMSVGDDTTPHGNVARRDRVIVYSSSLYHLKLQVSSIYLLPVVLPLISFL